MMASVVPRSTWKLRPSTARTTPVRVWKCTRRSSTSSSAMRCPVLVLRAAGIERVAQAVAQEVEREQRERQCQAGEEEQPGVLLHGLHAGRDELAPRRLRRLDAQAEEAQ